MKIIAIAVLALLVSASAPYAQTVTHPAGETAPSVLHPDGGVDMTMVIKDLNGDPVLDGSVRPPEPVPTNWKLPNMTLGRAIAIVMCIDRAGGLDANEAGIDKSKRCHVARGFMNDKDVVLDTETVAEIEKRIGGLQGTVGDDVTSAIAPQDLAKKK